MKISMIIGVITLYMFIVALELFASTTPTAAGTGTVGFANITTEIPINPAENTSVAINPTYSAQSEWLSNAWTAFTQAREFLIFWTQVFTLTAPTVFTGVMTWAWWYFCFPIDCGMVFAMFTIARGVHSA